MTDPSRTPPDNPFFAGLARAVLAYRWPLLALTLAIAGFFGNEVVQRFKIDSSTEAFLSPEAESRVILDQVREDFGADFFFQVVVEGDVFSIDFLKRLQALHLDLQALNLDLADLHPDDTAEAATEGINETATGQQEDADPWADDEGWGDETGGSLIEDVTSLINIRDTRWIDDGLRVQKLLPSIPEQPASLAALKRRVLSDDTMVGQVVGRKGRHAVLVVRAQQIDDTVESRLYDAVMELGSVHQAKGFDVQIGGMPVLNQSINRSILADMLWLFVLSMIVATLMLVLIFRHPLGVLGPLLLVAQSFVWTMGAMAMSDVPLTIITQILPAFLIAIGIGDSVHIQSIYRDNRRNGMANHDAIVHAVSSTGMPVLFTSLTTGVGLLSFQFASLQAIKDLGLFGAIGVMTALALSLVFLPIVLSFNGKSLLGARPVSHDNDWLDRFLGLCNRISAPLRHPDGSLSYHRQRWTMLGGLLMTVMCLVGMSRLALFHNPLVWIPEDNLGKQAIETIDDHVGGTANLSVLIEAAEGTDLRDREVLLGIERLTAHLHSYRDPDTGDAIVSNTTSVLDVVRESWRAIHGEDDAFYGVPDTQQGVVDMFTLFQNSGPDELKKLATVDSRKTLLMVRVKWLDAFAYLPLSDHIARGIEMHLTSGALQDRLDVKVTGSIYTVLEVVRTMVLDLLRSFGTAFVVITLIMILLLRDLKLGLIAMVPNLMPVMGVMGFMGFAGIHLDASTLLIASIGIGIAVDDTIHFLHQFRVHYQSHGDAESALRYSFWHTGRAMTSTSIILSAGFIVFMAADMVNIQRFGMLTVMVVVLALLIDLIFVPALLRTFYGRRPRSD